MIQIEVYEAIKNSGSVEEFEIDGIQYTDKKLFKVSKPTPDTMELNTLQGVVDLIIEEKLNDALIFIENEGRVVVRSGINPECQGRHTYCLSTPIFTTPFHFGQKYDQQSLAIALQSQCIQTDATKALIKFASSVNDMVQNSLDDDGITQHASVSDGLEFSKTKVPNPVKLAFMRSFSEIEQPESKFVFRANKGLAKGETTSFVLYEADGGAWKLEAIERIRAWFDTAGLPGGVKIIA